MELTRCSTLRSTLRKILLCAGIVLAICVPHVLLAQTFRNSYRIPTPVDPDFVATGDINGDGRPDVVWMDTTTTPISIHVLLAQTGGSYTPSSTVTLPASQNYPGMCLIFDATGDGNADLICTGGSIYGNSINVFPGRGDGTFGASLQTPGTNNVLGAYLVAAGDLNQDGKPDIVLIDTGYNIIPFLGDGRGGFTQKPEIGFGLNYIFPVLADINGDGKLDMLFPLGPQVALGNGDGTFQKPISYSQPFDPGSGIVACTFHDMDGDGHLDAVCGYPVYLNGEYDGYTKLIILHGNANGSFNTTPIASKTFGDAEGIYDGIGAFLTPLGVADVNGDGNLDILAASGDGLAVLLGGVGLTYSAPLHYADGWVAFPNSLVNLTQPLPVDMNGDGILDFVNVGPNGIYITYGVGNGTYASAFAPEVAETAGFATVADFNGDGIPDIVASGDPALKLSLGKGDGTFLAPNPLPRGSGSIDFSTYPTSSFGHVLHGDFNGDGKLDLMAIGSPVQNQYNSYLLFGNGDGTFQPPLSIANASFGYFALEYLTLGDQSVYDINHDGRSDIVTVTGTTPISLNTPESLNAMLSNGDGSFKTVVTNIPTDLSGNGYYSPVTPPVLVDFRHANQLDVAYASLRNLYILQGHGDGTFATSGTALPLPTLASMTSYGAAAVATGDFDGDGNADLVVVVQYSPTGYPDPLTSAAWVYYGHGDGTFSSPVRAGSFDRLYFGVFTADLNGDGLSDMVLTTEGTTNSALIGIGIVHGQTGRTFSSEVNYLAGTGLSSVAITDLNRDGLPDLVVGNGATGEYASSVTILLNEGTGAQTTTSLTCSPNPISAFGVATFAASVSSLTGTPEGGFTFTDNGAALAQFAGPTSAAAYTDTALVVGTHQIAVSFVPTGNYAGSSASCTEVVNALPTSSTLTVTPMNSTYGNPVTLTANVAPVMPINGHVPTGTVSFYYQGANQVFIALLGTAPLNAAGVAGLNLTTLQGGTGIITCTYSGDSAFAPSSCAGLTDTISAAASTLTLTSSLNPAPVLAPVTFSVHLTLNGQPAPVGDKVTLTLNGQAIVLASSNTTYTTSSLPVGSDPVTASFGGSASLLASSAALTEVIQLLPTTTTLVAAPNPAYQGQTVTLTATITAATTATGGSVTFFDGTTALGTGPTTTQSTNGPSYATLTTSTLAVGTHPLTAVYTPTNAAVNIVSGSTSAVVQEVVLASSFTLALSPTSVTLRGGQTATAAIQLASVGNFAGPVSLSVGALPTYATATISPTSVTLAAAGTGASTLTIKTMQHAENIAPPRPGMGPGSQSQRWPAVVAATLLLLLPYGGKRRAGLRGGLRVVLGLLWVGVLVQGLTGCTNAYYTDLVVAPGSYPVTVTGTDQSGSKQSATLTVVITP